MIFMAKRGGPEILRSEGWGRPKIFLQYTFFASGPLASVREQSLGCKKLKYNYLVHFFSIFCF